MATITGTVRIIDFLDDLVKTSTSAVRVSSGSGLTDIIRTGTVRVLDTFADDIVKTSTSVRRRSPGDLGYAGVPVVGTVLASAIMLMPGRTRVAFYPGAAYSVTLTSQRIDTGIQTNADSLPSVVALRNNSIDTGFVLTAAAIGGRTGCYIVTGTIPLTYVKGDRIQILAQSVVNGITENETLDMIELGGVPVAGQVWP